MTFVIKPHHHHIYSYRCPHCPNVTNTTWSLAHKSQIIKSWIFIRNHHHIYSRHCPHGPNHGRCRDWFLRRSDWERRILISRWTHQKAMKGDKRPKTNVGWQANKLGFYASDVGLGGGSASLNTVEFVWIAKESILHCAYDSFIRLVSNSD